jgi:hypothetical protein
VQKKMKAAESSTAFRHLAKPEKNYFFLPAAFFLPPAFFFAAAFFLAIELTPCQSPV